VAEKSSDAVAVQPLPPTLVAPVWSWKKAGEALALSADGSLLAVGPRTGGVLLFDADTGELHAEFSADQLSGQPSRLVRLAFAEQDQRLVAFSERC
jgi:hypothetical protein